MTRPIDTDELLKLAQKGKSPDDFFLVTQGDVVGTLNLCVQALRTALKEASGNAEKTAQLLSAAPLEIARAVKDAMRALLEKRDGQPEALRRIMDELLDKMAQMTKANTDATAKVIQLAAENLKPPPGTLLPADKGTADSWHKIQIDVALRDANGNIRTLELRKVE